MQETPCLSIETLTPKLWHRFIDEIEGLVQSFAYLNSIDDDGIYKLAATVREAATNAIVHGNRLDTTKKVKVDFYNCDDRIKIYVTDESDVRFDPISHFEASGENMLADHGRGYMIMKGFADALDYEWLAPGNRVKIEMLKSKTHISKHIDAEYTDVL